MVKKKEERKRGKKRPRTDKGDIVAEVEHQEEPGVIVPMHEGATRAPEDFREPGWMLPIQNAKDDTAPFGFVRADLKEYMRSANTALKNLLEQENEAGGTSIHSKEATRLRDAALSEARGYELELATDPDTSVVLENLITTMTPRHIRIVADGFMGNLFKLSCHRYGSHVLESILVALQGVATQEERQQSSLSRPMPSSGTVDQSGHGTLRTAHELISNLTEELLPTVVEMMQHPFATHIVRTWLVVLSGQCLDSAGTSASGNTTGIASLRSKRSAVFRTRIAHEASSCARLEPSVFPDVLQHVIATASQDLNGRTIKDMSGSPSASPTLAILLGVASRHGRTSLLDLALDGLVSASQKSDSSLSSMDRSAHIETLLRDQVGSLFLQSCLAICSDKTNDLFWIVYLRGRMCRLGSHVVANFVVAEVLRHLTPEQSLEGNASPLFQALQELREGGSELVKAGRLGVLQALVERCGAITFARESNQGSSSSEQKKEGKAAKKRGTKANSLADDDSYDGQVARAVLCAFGFDLEDKTGLSNVVPVILNVKTVDDWAAFQTGVQARVEDGPSSSARSLTEPKIQGSLLLQSICRLTYPSNDVVIRSLMEQQSIIPISRSPIGVHILLSALASPTTTFKQRSDITAKLCAELHWLADDKFGSRATDALWERTDGFTKEKIARISLEHEQLLLGSPYGRFFVRKLNLGLFRKSVGKWKVWLKDNLKPCPDPLPRHGQATLQKKQIERDSPPQGLEQRGNKKKPKLGHTDKVLDDILSAIK